MSWSRIDDKAWDHPKFEWLQSLELEGLAAIGLWTMLLSFSGQKLSASVSLKQATMLCNGRRDLAEKLLDLLRQARLIDGDFTSEANVNFASKQTRSKASGPVLHDWKNYRSKNEARVFAGQKGGVKSGESRREHNEANAKQTRSKASAVLRSKPEATDEFASKQTRTPDPDPDPDPGPDPKIRDTYVDPERECMNRRATQSGAQESATTPKVVRTQPEQVSLCEPSSSSLREPDHVRVPDKRTAEINAVFAHYRKYHPNAHKKPNSKSKEWRRVKARMEEGCTVEDLCAAIDGCHRTPWNMGENPDGKKYDSLELIVRDSSNVTRFMEQPKVREPTGKFASAYKKAMAIAIAEDEQRKREREKGEKQ